MHWMGFGHLFQKQSHARIKPVTPKEHHNTEALTAVQQVIYITVRLHIISHSKTFSRGFEFVTSQNDVTVLHPHLSDFCHANSPGTAFK